MPDIIKPQPRTNMIRHLLTATIFLICFKHSFSQETITVYNRSTSVIDSVVIAGKNYGQIPKASQNSLFVSGNQGNFHSIAPFDVNIYVKAQKFSQQYRKLGTTTYYFYDHGINILDTPLTQPTNFTLIVSNLTSRTFDTVLAHNTVIRKIDESTPRTKEVLFPFTNVDHNTQVSIKLGDTTFKTDLSFHNFNNWMDTIEAIYIENDSVLTTPRLNKPPLEYVVDLYLMGVPERSVEVISKHIIKSYKFQSIDYPVLRFVFDFQTLNAEGKIKIRVDNRTHVVKLDKGTSRHGHKFLFVTRNDVR